MVWLLIFSFCTLVTTLTTQWSEKKGPGSNELISIPFVASEITRSSVFPSVCVLKLTCCSKPIATKRILKFSHNTVSFVDVQVKISKNHKIWIVGNNFLHEFEIFCQTLMFSPLWLWSVNANYINCNIFENQLPYTMFKCPVLTTWHFSYSNPSPTS